MTVAGTMTFKRKEVKFLLTKEQRAGFLADIASYIEEDTFGKYTICNIYYDTPDNRLIRRSIEKPVYKEKMRVRSYGKANETSKVFIELKKKYDGIVYKRRIAMGYNEANAYIEGDAVRNGQIEDEIDYFIGMYQGIAPAMYISYDRQAFAGISDPSLRITFDDNVLWRDEDVALSSGIYGHTILEENQSLLEIKCADAMPLWLTQALTKHKIYRTSFSKYGKAYTQKAS